MMPWRVFIARAGIAAGLFGLAMFVALRLAAADPGGPTRPEMTFAGVLRRDATGAPFVGDTTLTFQFFKASVSVCSVTTRSITFTVAMGGAFTVPVPIGSPCPTDLFDGADVTYNVTQDLPAPATPIAMNVAVTPVPYARFADQAGIGSDCPAGYTRAGTGSPIVCTRTFVLGSPLQDEVVKVGTGSSAFWVDRYEASVYDRTGTLLGTGSSDTYPGFPKNGQWAPRAPPMEPPVLALSRAAVLPSANITWFQANEACRASGKRLMTHDEWFAAASGTVDSVTNCQISPGNLAPRMTSASGRCTSVWGAQDMIGNLAEWTDEWYTGAGSPTAIVNNHVQNWPADYNADYTSNVNGVATVDLGGTVGVGIPAAAHRGGIYNYSAFAGIFAMDLQEAPSYGNPVIGFRCVVIR